MKEAHQGHSWGPYLRDGLGSCGRLCQPGCGAASHLSRQGVDVESRSSPRAPRPRSSLLACEAAAPPGTASPHPACSPHPAFNQHQGASSLSSGLWSPNRVWASLGLRGCGPGGSTGLGAPEPRRLGSSLRGQQTAPLDWLQLGPAGCGSGQVLAASQLRRGWWGVEVDIRVC